MSQTFKVGEVAIVAYAGSKYDGMEVKIDKRLGLCRDPEGRTWFGYRTTHVCDRGLILSPAPHHLRKKNKGDDGLRVSESNKLSSPKKVGQPSIKQPERAIS